MAIGMSVVTVLSMIGAILIAPAATSLLGHRINKWQIGRTPADDGGVISRIVARVSRRAALAAALLAALLLLIAAPVLAIKTTPPDPRVLPKDSPGLAAFEALRKARFGPEIDVALAAPDRDAARSARLASIAHLEQQIARLPDVRAVTGPGLVADATTDVRNAPKQIGKSRRDLSSRRERAHLAIAPARPRPPRSAPASARCRTRPRTQLAACSTPGAGCWTQPQATPVTSTR